MYRIKKGLNLPIEGSPADTVVPGPDVSHVAVQGPDYIGMKPTMAVNEGDRVRLGQELFSDKKTEGVRFTSPASGTVSAVNRGDKRRLLSVVIEIDGDEAVEFPSFRDAEIGRVAREEVTQRLTDSGLWAAFRTRPFSRTPTPGSQPHSIFVQAIDTNPLAADPLPIIREREKDFYYGLQALTRLVDGDVHVCRQIGVILPGDDLDGVQSQEFGGPHPAGLPGTHIHFVDAVGRSKTVWTINYQDVLEIGSLMVTGRLNPERIISLAGPAVKEPRLIRTRRGACLKELTEGQLNEGPNRVISGSVLSGRAIQDAVCYLGRFHQQVSVIPENSEREFLGWAVPGTNQFSVRNVFVSSLNRAKKFAFSTSTNGSPRAMVPIGMYEQVMPLDIIPTFLLRALITGDNEQAVALGALELDEDDLGLCTFVCPGKTEYGPLLRERLRTIEAEG